MLYIKVQEANNQDKTQEKVTEMRSKMALGLKRSWWGGWVTGGHVITCYKVINIFKGQPAQIPSEQEGDTTFRGGEG